MRLLILASLLFVTFTATPALAGCADPPEPGVNWQRCNFNGVNLTELDLEGARLRETSFLRADISGSNLRGIEGFKLRLVNTTAREVDFEGASLPQADLTKADLTGANLTAADLRNARLNQAILRDADLSGVNLDGAELTEADLSGATWTDGERICREGSIGRCF